MLKFVSLATTLSVAAISVLGFSKVVVAQSRYVQVGEGSGGIPIYLDLKTVQGTSFKLYSRYGTETISETGFSANCGERRLFSTRVALYSTSGGTITAENTKKDVSAVKPTSPAGTAMRFVCRRIGAKGW